MCLQHNLEVDVGHLDLDPENKELDTVYHHNNFRAQIRNPSFQFIRFEKISGHCCVPCEIIASIKGI